MVHILSLVLFILFKKTSLKYAQSNLDSTTIDMLKA